MRYFVSLLMSCFLLTSTWAQIEKVGTSGKKCYEKLDSRRGKQFVDWECGKVIGVVDCNEKLEYDEGSNTFFSKGTGSPFSGQCETCHRNGIRERVVTFVNGKENGPDTTTYYDGCIMVIRNHINGKEHGKWTYFYDSTQYTAWEINYNNGIKNGVSLYLSPEGDTTLYENYIGGLLTGQRKTYYAGGKIEKITTYAKGIMNGPFTVYNKEGKQLQNLTYKNGQKNGVAYYYYDDGTLMRTENWLSGIQNGEFKTVYYDGTLQSLENYVKGLKEGWFEERYNDQKLKRKALYKKDVLVIDHVYDKEGNEVYTFGAQPTSDFEDDQMPAPSAGKKDKKQKEKKKKTKGE